VVVKPATDPGHLESRYKAETTLRLQLSPRLSGSDLLRMCERHTGRAHTTALLSMIVCHRHATPAVLECVLRQARRDPRLLDAVVTSGHASEDILRKLARSRQRTVRQHAELGLLTKRLSRPFSAGFVSAVLRRHAGDEGIALGVRSLVAGSKRTPVTILRRLASDEADQVAETARRNLATRQRAQRSLSGRRRTRKPS
jgi:hypothetical protein